MKIADHIAVFSLMTTCLLVSPAVLADVFVAPFGGYSFGTRVFNIKSADAGNLENDEGGKLTFLGSENYGAMMGFTTQDPGDIYLIYSHQAIVFRTDASVSTTPMVDLDYFTKEVQSYADFVRASPPSDPNGKVLIPGDKEIITNNDRMHNGLPVAPIVWENIRQTAEKLNISRLDRFNKAII